MTKSKLEYQLEEVQEYKRKIAKRAEINGELYRTNSSELYKPNSSLVCKLLYFAYVAAHSVVALNTYFHEKILNQKIKMERINP